MKHSKEWHTCDRCGAEVKALPAFFSSVSEKFGEPTEIRMICDDVEVYCGKVKGWSEEVFSVSVIEAHTPKDIRYDLCPRCKREFRRFMRNE